MVTILGPDGKPIPKDLLSEPQTSRIAGLHHEFQNHPARGLTPSRLAQILQDAEQGDMIAQFELFEDMEERDGHILSEMSKRRNAVAGLTWDIVPPPNASAAEKKAANRVQELVGEIDDFESVLFNLTDGIGKGFSAMEIQWTREAGIWLPSQMEFCHQSKFKLLRGFRQEFRLRDNTVDGQELQPARWLIHEHKAKSGLIERSSLFRALVWPYLFKNYSIADLGEWLEIYGIPFRVGKYTPGAGEKEKATLLRALVGIGHNAAGIIPNGMELEFHDAATGDAKAFELMLDWCERTVSKVILGATLTSQADRGSNTNALGNVHNEVRKDIRDSDAKRLRGTLTRDLLYPISLLNGWCDSPRRAPRFMFDLSEAEDIAVYAEALPKLVGVGMQIPCQWAQEQLGIPEPEDGQEVLRRTEPATPRSAIESDDSTPNQAPVKPELKVVKATGEIGTEIPSPPSDYIERLAQRLSEESAASSDQWQARIAQIVQQATSYDDMLHGLAELYGNLPLDAIAASIESAMSAADMAGRYDVLTGYSDA